MNWLLILYAKWKKSQKRSNIVLIHLYELSKVNKSIETESSLQRLGKVSLEEWYVNHISINKILKESITLGSLKFSEEIYLNTYI